MSLTAQQLGEVIRAGVPMAEDIGFTVDEAGEGFAKARLIFSERLIRPGGTLSGPVQMALADAAMYAAVMATIGQVEMAVTSNLSINFLEKPAPGDLIADAVVLRLGRRIAFCEVRLLSPDPDGGDDVLVAHVTGSYSLPGKR
jgi:uncharacterized protein (TIGR00369 family)